MAIPSLFHLRFDVRPMALTLFLLVSSTTPTLADEAAVDLLPEDDDLVPETLPIFRGFGLVRGLVGGARGRFDRRLVGQGRCRRRHEQEEGERHRA
ncbi:MAG: hypothetical protein AAGE94_21100, partial [Acidobacteriota bacterium]